MNVPDPISTVDGLLAATKCDRVFVNRKINRVDFTIMIIVIAVKT